MAKIYEPYIFGCISISTIELVLWLLKFFQKKSCCSDLHVKSATICLLHGTTFDYIIKHFKGLIQTCLLFVKW